MYNVKERKRKEYNRCFVDTRRNVIQQFENYGGCESKGKEREIDLAGRAVDVCVFVFHRLIGYNSWKVNNEVS